MAHEAGSLLWWIAPGVVLIKAPGHTPGSQVVYVQLASGREVILSGDVAWLPQAQRAGVSVVVSHDGAQLTSLAHQGILSEGLLTR